MATSPRRRRSRAYGQREIASIATPALRTRARDARTKRLNYGAARWLALVVILVGLADVYSTNVALGAGDAREFNPIVDWLQVELGVYWVFPKMAVHLLLAAMILWYPNLMTLLALTSVSALVLTVSMNNMSIYYATMEARGHEAAISEESDAQRPFGAAEEQRRRDERPRNNSEPTSHAEPAFEAEPSWRQAPAPALDESRGPVSSSHAAAGWRAAGDMVALAPIWGGAPDRALSLIAFARAEAADEAPADTPPAPSILDAADATAGPDASERPGAPPLPNAQTEAMDEAATTAAKSDRAGPDRADLSATAGAPKGE